jgi:hypothetical protein
MSSLSGGSTEATDGGTRPLAEAEAEAEVGRESPQRSSAPRMLTRPGSERALRMTSRIVSHLRLQKLIAVRNPEQAPRWPTHP